MLSLVVLLLALLSTTGRSYLSDCINIITSQLSQPLNVTPGKNSNYKNENNKLGHSGFSQFTLKHIYHHNTGENHRIHRRLDITKDLIIQNELYKQTFKSEFLSPEMKMESPWLAKYTLSLNSNFPIRRMRERHPDFVESYLQYIHKDVVNAEKVHLDWVEENELVPNVTDKESVVNLALMASDAYVEVPGTGDWTDVAEPWKNRSGFGWMSDGIRGHVFSNTDNSIVVIALKGTSAAFVSRLDTDGKVISEESIEDDFKIQGGADTVANDKINDNLLFSCCCARVSYLWTTVCDCYKSSYTCDQKCLEKELLREDRYYQAVLDLYRNVTSQYSQATVWVTGHSLGGSLASLLGRTYGLPAVTFQAPGELMATKRLHLPMPPGLPGNLEHIWHFGNTGDPIFMGVCNGASSTCSLGGYAMESMCHSGKTCVYDTVTDLGWSVSIYNHRIHTVIDNIILHYNETAKCTLPSPCQDCFNWRYVVDDKNDKYKPPLRTATWDDDDDDDWGDYRTETSSSTSSTPSKPQKCKRYSWLGKCIEWEDGL